MLFCVCTDQVILCLYWSRPTWLDLKFSGTPARLRVLKNGESDRSRAVTVVGPDLTNVSCFWINNFNNYKILIGCSLTIRDTFGGGREGWASTKTNSVQKKPLKKTNKKLCKVGSHTKRNWARAFYYPSQFFNLLPKRTCTT